MTQKKILIITFSGDNQCIEMVTKQLEKNNVEVFRFDTERYPTETTLSLKEGGQGREMILTLPDGKEIDLQQLDAVWYRRMRVGWNLPDEMEDDMRDASIQEARTVILGLFSVLPCFVLGKFHNLRLAANKQLQLQIARSLGLEIPRTLTTNAPHEVEAFYHSCPGGIVTKALSSFTVDVDGVLKVMYTTKIEESDLQDLDSLCLCPMTFQEDLPKKLELRVTIVGNEIFAASIDSQSSPKAVKDWRRDGDGLIAEWKEYTLPQEIQGKLLALMDYFKLNYGAIDIIVTPDDDYVFLEINPAGEFFWLEEENPHFPISTAIADLLLNKSKRRQ